jgi:hypothetical protein
MEAKKAKKKKLDDAQRKELHASICQFHTFANQNIRVHIENVRAIYNGFPKDLKNDVLVYLLNSAVNGTFESLVNKLTQAADLIDRALKDLGKSEGLIRSDTVAKLFHVRNIILAHRFEIYLSNQSHVKRFYEKYKTPVERCNLIERAMFELMALAEQLMAREDFLLHTCRERRVKVISEHKIVEILNAVKLAGIY